MPGTPNVEATPESTFSKSPIQPRYLLPITELVRDRRARYREPQGLETIKVSMAWLGHDYVGVSLIDLSARGATVAVPAGQVPSALRIGLDVYLRFEFPEIDPISDILALIGNARDSRESRLFGLEILDWQALSDKLPPRLFSAFNRRRHHRVDVPKQPGTDVAVLNLESGQTATATLSNVSASGCLLLFRLEEGPQAGESLQIKFCLPGSAYRFDLLGSAKNTSKIGDSARCGIEFDDSESREFLAQQEQISQYVMQRQRELRIGHRSSDGTRQ